MFENGESHRRSVVVTATEHGGKAVASGVLQVGLSQLQESAERREQMAKAVTQLLFEYRV